MMTDQTRSPPKFWSAFAVPISLPGLRRTPSLAACRIHHKPNVFRCATEAAGTSPATSSLTDAFDAVVMKTYSRFPLALSHGVGATLFAVDGTKYLDFVAGIATCTLGHADSRIINAVSAQVRKLGHVSNLYYIPEQGQLARWLVDNSPADKVFFCNSGAEANEAAIKLTRKYWHSRVRAPSSSSVKDSSASQPSPVILTANNSFHGRTLATITATGQPKYQQGFQPLLPGFQYIEYNSIESLHAAADALGDNLAGIMLEALQGEGGVCPGTTEFFAAVRQVCDRTGALLICDEVQVGVGRTGRLWGFENVGVEPDVFTVAKGLGGGVPIGAMLCKSKYDVFQPGDHASTFGGNPLAAAAALAIANALDRDDILQNVRARGEQLRNGLDAVAAKHPGVFSEVRGWGLINGAVLSENTGINSARVVTEAMKLGLLIVPAGPSVVRFVPPLVVTPEETDSAIATFDLAIKNALIT